MLTRNALDMQEVYIIKGEEPPMYLLYNDSTDPAFNLALEEYALTQLNEDIIMLWRNAPAVIIGQNQNAIAEMDLDYIRENNIKVIRRQSGGGAVFHDLGNINFTVIHALGKDDFNNYAKFTAPICEFLNTLGVKAYLHGRNDLLIDGLKFSGNAQAVRGGRIMHHGTLLFNADVTALAKSLRPNPAKIQSKGIASVKSRITNIAAHLPKEITVEEFLLKLYDFFGKQEGIEEYCMTNADRAATNELVDKKYGTWEWNIGNSPPYQYNKSEYFPFGSVEVSINAKNALIDDIAVRGDFFGVNDIAELEAKLCGIPHEKKEIELALKDINLADYISGIEPEQFLKLF